MTNQEYGQLADRMSPNTRSGRSLLLAFLIGGLICTFGEFLSNLYQNMGLETDVAASATSVSLIFLAALLTGLNIYDNIAKYGGAGTLVPITGFSNSMAAAAMEFKSEGLILGLGAKMFTIAGPVIVYGTAASIIYGLILYLFQLV